MTRISDRTVLFADLRGSTALFESLGNAEATSVVTHCINALGSPVTSCGGLVVKTLGDGLMAVFDDAADAVDAALESSERVRELEVDGYRPQLRAGIHFGKPRKLGSDYFGVDVNIAARVADEAGPSQVLVSETVRERLDGADVSLRRQWRFRAQGTPKGLKVFSADAA
jgi:adenylate cyclase